MTVVADDGDVSAVIRDALRATHVVNRMRSLASIDEIARQRPEILLIAPIVPGPAGGPATAWDLVGSARAHRELRDVPVVVLAPDLDAVMSSPRLLRDHADMHVLGMPFDLDTLESVLGSIRRAQRERHGVDRLPRVCPHGFGFAGEAIPPGCMDCRPIA